MIKQKVESIASWSKPYSYLIEIMYRRMRSLIEASELTEEHKFFEALRHNNVNLASLVSKCNNRMDINYALLHNTSGYQMNNWGLPLLDMKEIQNAKSILELGAGNAQLTQAINLKYGGKCTGLDLENPNQYPVFVLSSIENLDSNFLKSYELIISADFLEHVILPDIQEFLKKSSTVCGQQLHIIACYDDGESHTSVFLPHEWALIFSKYYQFVEIREIKYRRFPFRKKAVTIYCKNV